MKTLQILICSLLQPKHLVIFQEKRRGGKNSPFLSFATKYRCPATYDLNIEAFFFAIG